MFLDAIYARFYALKQVNPYQEHLTTLNTLKALKIIIFATK